MTEKKNETLLDVVQWWTRCALLVMIVAFLVLLLYPAMLPDDRRQPTQFRCIAELRVTMRAYQEVYGRLPAGTTVQIIRQLEPFCDKNHEGKSNYLEECVAENFSEIAFSTRPMPEQTARDNTIRVVAYAKGSSPDFIYTIDDTFNWHSGNAKDLRHVPAEQLLNRNVYDVFHKE